MRISLKRECFGYIPRSSVREGAGTRTRKQKRVGNVPDLILSPFLNHMKCVNIITIYGVVNISRDTDAPAWLSRLFFQQADPFQMALRRVHVAYGSASSPASPVGGRPAVPKFRKGWPEIKSARIFSCHNFWIWKNRETRPGTSAESGKNTRWYLMNKALS